MSGNSRILGGVEEAKMSVKTHNRNASQRKNETQIQTASHYRIETH